MNLFIVRIFDVNLGKVKICFLDMCISKGGIVEELFSSIDNCMSLFRIFWSNWVVVGVDNISVNMGKKNLFMIRV